MFVLASYESHAYKMIPPCVLFLGCRHREMGQQPGNPRRVALGVCCHAVRRHGASGRGETDQAPRLRL